MTTFWRDGLWRTSVYGMRHWVECHSAAHVRTLCSFLGLLSGMPSSALAGEATHCTNTEAVIFNCQVSNGKLVSVCASAQLDASRGYLQYRFGALGRIELEHPRDIRSTQKQFEFGVTRAPAVEVEQLNFTRGSYLYSVYRRITNEGGSQNGGGVVVSGVSTMEVITQMECWPPATFPRMGLERVVPAAGQAVR